ncbi:MULTISPECIES: phage tail protein [unclassified Pantoea]|uniref:phage tail protein n=1 Tax=unclassified Pantoea TaxID=2630326 RepID=UPI001CD48450|nr:MULTISPECIES: phage tail protein [unclassified Pantoea]MCA1179776.1 phage tail protein [Pantoea sp. alder69]MCA1253622.1 phage tail protein [Pantoea sp. alder70]MCA1268262.1 phage tail protein [Pantoea sp. alder81]
MNDLFHIPGGDLNITLSGDVRLVSHRERINQRILRRLITNPGDNIFDPEYGAGLGQKVGETFRPGEWKALITGQVLLEHSVAEHPPPVIKLTQTQDSVSVSISYTDVTTGTSETLSFDVTR